MGCHTWFQRPITKEEREKLRQTAKDYILDESGCLFDAPTTDKLLESVEKDTDMWLEYSCYTYNDFIIKIDDVFYVDLSEPCNDHEVCCNITEYFHNVFRVKRYPNWKIHNRYELRKKMGKKYFDLTQEQLDTISRFFQIHPDGVITFG